MVQIFDLPPGGLMDGAVAKEVNPDGSPKESVSAEEVNPVPTENSQILRKEFINADNNRKPIFNRGPKSEVTVTVVPSLLVAVAPAST